MGENGYRVDELYGDGGGRFGRVIAPDGEVFLDGEFGLSVDDAQKVADALNGARWVAGEQVAVEVGPRTISELPAAFEAATPETFWQPADPDATPHLALTFTQSPERAVRLSKDQMESLATKGEWSESFTVTDSNLDIPVGAVIELPEAVEGEMTTKYAIARAAGNPGCGARLAKGQWWGFCGETDMGQSMPALCEQCGGEYKRAPGALPDPQLAPRRAGPTPLTAAEVTEPGWYWYRGDSAAPWGVLEVHGVVESTGVWLSDVSAPALIPFRDLPGTFIGPLRAPD